MDIERLEWDIAILKKKDILWVWIEGIHLIKYTNQMSEMIKKSKRVEQFLWFGSRFK